jgi:hypothetical protein
MLPNLIVIGAMKCGTSSLHSYLDLHPQITMSSVKELNYFIAEQNWSRGAEWYESNFTGDTKVVGESSPNYTKCHFFSDIPERMYSVLPEARLIYILRDPVDRVVSHYIHNYHRGRERGSISEALADLGNSHYVQCSKYYMQLEKFLGCYPQSSILIITLEGLGRYRQRTLQKVFQFLEVDDSVWRPGFSEVVYKSSDKRRQNLLGALLSKMPGKDLVKPFFPVPVVRAYDSLTHSRVRKPSLSQGLRQRLIDHLQDDVDSLREYAGDDFADWCL